MSKKYIIPVSESLPAVVYAVYRLNYRSLKEHIFRMVTKDPAVISRNTYEEESKIIKKMQKAFGKFITKLSYEWQAYADINVLEYDPEDSATIDNIRGAIRAFVCTSPTFMEMQDYSIPLPIGPKQILQQSVIHPFSTTHPFSTIHPFSLDDERFIEVALDTMLIMKEDDIREMEDFFGEARGEKNVTQENSSKAQSRAQEKNHDNCVFSINEIWDGLESVLDPKLIAVFPSNPNLEQSGNYCSGWKDCKLAFLQVIHDELTNHMINKELVYVYEDKNAIDRIVNFVNDFFSVSVSLKKLTGTDGYKICEKCIPVCSGFLDKKDLVEAVSDKLIDNMVQRMLSEKCFIVTDPGPMVGVLYDPYVPCRFYSGS